MKKATKMMINEGTHIAMKAFVPIGTLKGLGKSPSPDPQYTGRDEDQRVGRHKQHHVYDHNHTKWKQAHDQAENPQ